MSVSIRVDRTDGGDFGNMPSQAGGESLVVSRRRVKVAAELASGVRASGSLADHLA